MADRNDTSAAVIRMQTHLFRQMEELTSLVVLATQNDTFHTSVVADGLAQRAQYLRGYTKAMLHSGHIDDELAGLHSAKYDQFCPDVSDGI
ncbi:hypothetical protein EGT07_23895 [Herbaspirillum sp. HC18]|nr:hypothetical protein EGT07_23895 [Herbaspirillum sp. HC18]